jgi:hypothetical protein
LVRLWWREQRWYSVLGTFVLAILLRLVIIWAGYGGIVGIVLVGRAVPSAQPLIPWASMVSLCLASVAAGALGARIVRNAPVVMLSFVWLSCVLLAVGVSGIIAEAFPSPIYYFLGERLVAGPGLAFGALVVLEQRRTRAR